MSNSITVTLDRYRLNGFCRRITQAACLPLRGLASRLRIRLDSLLPAQSLRRRFAHGAAWAVLGAGVSQGFAMLGAIVRARLLGKTGYGELGTVLTTMGMLGVFAGMGIGLTVTKFVAEYRRSDPARAGRIIGMSGIVAILSALCFAVLGWLASPWLARSLFQAPHLDFAFRLGCGMLFFNTLAGAQSGVLAGLESFRALAFINAWAGLLGFAVGLAGLVFWALPGAVGGLALAAAASWAVNAAILRRELSRAGITIAWRPHRGEGDLLWKYAFPALLSQALFVPAPFILSAMLVRRQGGYGELGVFNATQSWMQLILFLPTMISQATLPMLSNLWGEGRIRQYARLLAANAALLAAAALAVAVPLACAAPWIMPVYGPGFAGGDRVLMIVCGTSVLWAVLIPLGQAIWSAGAVRSGVLLAGARLVLLVGFFRLFIGMGALGMALAYALTYLVQLLYLVPLIYHKVSHYLKSASISPSVSSSVSEHHPGSVGLP